MGKIIVLFIAAILLTAVFSYSLQVFLQEDWIRLTLTTMLIPCFTWSILLLISYKKLTMQKCLKYFVIAGWVCVIGSAVLVPAGIYNFMVNSPDVKISVISVLFCVVLMSVLFFVLLKKNKFSSKWK